jgi:hypothetical protein
MACPFFESEVAASHEPEVRFVDFQALAIFRFMGTEQFKKEHGASHEPRMGDGCLWAPGFVL